MASVTGAVEAKLLLAVEQAVKAITHIVTNKLTSLYLLIKTSISIKQ
jgi:hypothetical protein